MLSLVRGYLTSFGSKKKYDSYYLMANHNSRRLFSVTTAKTKTEKLVCSLLFALWLGSGGWGVYKILCMSYEQRKKSFEELKEKLVEPGLVESVVVRKKQVAEVYLKRAPRPLYENCSRKSREIGGYYDFYFNIERLDTFEDELVEVQKELGIDPQDYVPVSYDDHSPTFYRTRELALSFVFLPIFLVFWKRGAGGKAAPPITKVFLKDIGGCDEAKQEVMEFVHFLKNPQKYKELGAKIPKGALMVGPPGTGKTLLAKATANESGVPFLSISSSEFMETTDGVGSSRMRNLFQEARQRAPSIIFIDEIGAIGQAGSCEGSSGSNDERESTLNQLLVEMDGLSTTPGVVVLARTNRPDTLDESLLRPGRFDRQITLDKPDSKGREEIFVIYLKKFKLGKELSWYSQKLAARTPGFAGADIANVCDKAALIAATDEETLEREITMKHFDAAIDNISGGIENKNMAS